MDIRILRARKGVPGVGRRLARELGNGFDSEVTCNYHPLIPLTENTMVINYGRSQWPIWIDNYSVNIAWIFLNNPEAVKLCSNKVLTFETLSDYNLYYSEEIPILSYTTDKLLASFWLEDGKPVIVRHNVTGSKGKGIELVNPGEELPDAPLYTQFYDKTHEFRVHICGGRVIDYVQKKRMGKKKRETLGLEEANDLVRNHKKGWVFAHKDILHFPEIEFACLLAAQELGIDFCAVDVLAKVEGETLVDFVICEVNSAPGMSSPTTFNAYIKRFKELYDEFFN